MKKKFSSKRLMSLWVLSLFLTTSPLLAATKEERLISHVQTSIENAEKGISHLNAAVLHLDGLSSSVIRHFLNNVCSLDGTSYLEIGCWKGSTLVSATYNNERHLSDVVAIDNWSLLGGPKKAFLQNVQTYMKNVPLRFYEQDCFAIDKEDVFYQPINVYFYDGEHTFADQKAAFTFYDSVFDDVFIAIVDDWNWEQVQKGTLEAFRELNYEVLYERAFFTKANQDKRFWWNGFYIAVIKKGSDAIR